MPNPFYYGGYIKDPSQFVGRSWELRQIFSLLDIAQTGQLQSISIVGPRRIGRSSLLYHVVRVCRQYLTAPDRYLFALLDLESGRYTTLPDLLGGIVQELSRGVPLTHGRGARSAYSVLDRVNHLVTSKKGITLPVFTEAIEALSELPGPRRWPVVCLDEFEQLIEDPYREHFPEKLYDCWRALISGSHIAFVTVSQQQLKDLAAQKELTSPFFNVFTVVPLGEFTDSEARGLLDRGRTCDWPFSDAECEAVLRMAGRHPYKLQCAGSLMYQHKVGGQPVNLRAVRKQCEYQFRAVEVRPTWWRAGSEWIRHGLWSLFRSPRYIGRLARFIGFGQDDLRNWMVGVIVLVLVALIVLGVINWDAVLRYLK